MSPRRTPHTCCLLAEGQVATSPVGGALTGLPSQVSRERVAGASWWAGRRPGPSRPQALLLRGWPASPPPHPISPGATSAMPTCLWIVPMSSSQLLPLLLVGRLPPTPTPGLCLPGSSPTGPLLYLS